MKIEDNRWKINSRDIWHGTECFEHCLKLSMAVEAEIPEAVERVSTHKESGGAEFRKVQGNEYETLRNAELAANLGNDFIEIPQNSDSDQVVEWALQNKIVIAQAPFEIDFGDFDYRGRADLLVRSDFELAYQEDGTLTALKEEGRVQDGKYCIWEIKHASKFNSDGKEQKVEIYQYQLAMAYEGLSALGVASNRACGIIFKESEMTTFEPEEILEKTRFARTPMFSLLNEVGPHRKKALAVSTWSCEKPSTCKSAKCEYSDICELVRYENDDLHQIYNIHHTHVPKLKAVGVNTVAKLLRDGAGGSGVASEQIEKHLRWAKVIAEHRLTGEPSHDKFADVFQDPGALPERTEADLFVDFEWYTPLNTRGYFYYMFGVLDRQGNLEQFIAKNQSQEQEMFTRFLDRVESAIISNPNMHFYVANKVAEKTAIEKLGTRYGIDQERITSVLSRIFDVQEAAKNSVVVSVGGFGLKEMAVFFSGKKDARNTATSDGDDSMWQYHEHLRLMKSGQSSEAQSIIDDIAKYNGDDCRATMRFYDWLAGI